MPLLDVILAYDCNLGCDYCTITPAMRLRSLTPTAVVAAMQQARRDGFDALSITGGEPTLRGDLLPLIRHGRALGFAQIKVQSNGLLWAHPPNVAKAIEAGVTQFAVSIHAYDRVHYEAIVGRTGTYDAMVAGLSGLVAQGVDPVADVIVMRSTMATLRETIVWLHDLGVARADLWFVSLTDGNAANVASMPAMTQAVPRMREAFAEGRRLGVAVRSLHVPRCLLGEDSEHAFDPAAAGVRVVTPDATFDLSGSRLTGQLHVPACAGCVHEPICPGLREDYLARYGDVEVAAARGQEPTRRGAVSLPLA